jgi:PAS domain S-box-containing protein
MSIDDKTAFLVAAYSDERENLTDCLCDAGFEVHLAASLPHALRQPDFSESSLILLDPPEDIVSADLEAVLDEAPEASVITVIDTDARTRVLPMLAAHRTDYLVKPICVAELRFKLVQLSCQRRILADLKDSARFIRRVADTAPRMIYLFDLEYACSVYVNQTLCADVGCNPDGLEPRGYLYFADLVHPADLDRLQHSQSHRLLAASADDVVESEYRIRTAIGDWRWYKFREVVFSRTADDQPKQILGTAQDSHVRRELEETRAHLAAVVESSDDAIIGKTLDGAIESWNPAAERLYGFTAEEAIGKNISLLVPPDHADELPNLLNRIRRGEHVDPFHTQRIRKDGQRVQVSISISPIISNGKIMGASTIARSLPVGDGTQTE